MNRLKTPLRWLLALAMIAVGVTHFTSPVPFERIVPSFIPWPKLAVAVSGVAEIAGGLGLLVPFTRRAAAWGLIALYVAVFPANVYMALRHVQPGDTPVPEWAAWARLPFQFVLIAWAYWYAKRDDAKG